MSKADKTLIEQLALSILPKLSGLNDKNAKKMVNTADKAIAIIVKKFQKLKDQQVKALAELKEKEAKKAKKQLEKEAKKKDKLAKKAAKDKQIALLTKGTKLVSAEVSSSATASPKKSIAKSKTASPSPARKKRTVVVK
ncbi:hypothetical protein HME7025_00998 [Aquirufa nivalisilvae]|uniref:Uncharacterized protein n=1 Tax=Aquirufa nivalisilvae TaxID=2516557 RepID=A0A2S2DU95_9BACT|nr:hypothetical protein [Aquirufa nivalisilvae]AWL08862.1 hypothetical protein HME7025_00998 [Aquirufa nivalisilvae]